MEHLLELVDDHDVGAPRTPDGVADPDVEVVLRGEDGDPVAPSSQRGDQSGAHQGRLPAARRTGHGEEARAGDPGERGADVGVPPEELVLVLDAERLQPPIRAGGAGDRWCLVEVERVVVPQDAELELRELRAGLHAEFVGESFAGLADRGERVGLPAAPVEGRGEQHPASLPERRPPHESLGLRDGCGVLAQPQSCVEPHLLQVHPHLVEPLGLHERGRPAGEVGIRDAAPERECAVGGVRGPRRVVVEVLSSGCRESFEPLRVDGVGVDAQRVRPRRGLDGVAPDRGPHPADRRLQLLRPGPRQFVAPQGLGELVGRDRTARAEHQRREHRALPRAERGPLEGERAEDCHAHAPHCSPIPDDRQ